MQDWADYYSCEPWGFELENMLMARRVWAQLQPLSKTQLDETRYLLKCGTRPPLTPEEYRAKSMRAYRGHGAQEVQGNG